MIADPAVKPGHSGVRQHSRAVAQVTGTVPAPNGPGPRPGRLAVPLAQRRCWQADTNRVGRVTDRRIATGQANNQQ